jgi:hypothetical protein
MALVIRTGKWIGGLMVAAGSVLVAVGARRRRQGYGA